MNTSYLRKAGAIVSIVAFLLTQKIGTVPDPKSSHSLSGTVPIFCVPTQSVTTSGDCPHFSSDKAQNLRPRDVAEPKATGDPSEVASAMGKELIQLAQATALKDGFVKPFQAVLAPAGGTGDVVGTTPSEAAAGGAGVSANIAT